MRAIEEIFTRYLRFITTKMLLIVISSVMAMPALAKKNQMAQIHVSPSGVCFSEDEREAFGKITRMEGSLEQLKSRLNSPNIEKKERLDLLIELGRDHYFTPYKEKEALLYLDEALTLAPVDLKALYYRACAHSAIINSPQNQQLAKRDFAELVRLAPQNPQFWIDSAELVRREYNWAEALFNYDNAVKAAPNSSRVLHQRGYFFIQQKQFVNAVRDFAKAQDIDSNYSPPSNDLEAYFSQVKNLDQIIAEFDEQLKKTPDAHYFRLQRSALLVRTKRYADALADMNYLNERQEIHFSMENYREALADANKSITLIEKRKGDYVKDFSHADRGQIHAKLKSFDLAVLDFIPTNGSVCDQECYKNISLLRFDYRNKENFDLAKKQFQKKIEKSENLGLFHFNMAMLLTMDIYFDRPFNSDLIEFHLQKSKVNKFKSYGLNIFHGEVLAQMGKYREALKLSNLELKLFKNTRAHYLKGHIFKKYKNYKQAAAEFDIVKEIDFRSSFAYHESCRMRVLGRIEYDQAFKDCSASLENIFSLDRLKQAKMNPVPFSIYFMTAGRLALLRNNPDDALAKYYTALLYDPNSSSAVYGKAMALKARGDIAEGAKLESEALAKDPNAAIQFEELSMPGDL
jgi:tetratricopeptide (TPR) repeat protein